LPCCLPYGKTGGLQILCCQGIKVTDYNFNLDALALKPSDFCNVRVAHPDIFCWVSSLYPTYLPAIFVLPVKPNKIAEDRIIP
jgi:hypothetical protein